MMLTHFKICSGGQTGADRAALDWAIAKGIPHGGWCPTGRLAEDGVIPAKYHLDELLDGGYLERNRANVRDSDATLIVSLSEQLSGGSLQTMKFAMDLRKPCLHVSPRQNWTELLKHWYRPKAGRTLNVAGPRASKAPGIEAFVVEVLEEVWRDFIQSNERLSNFQGS